MDKYIWTVEKMWYTCESPHEELTELSHTRSRGFRARDANYISYKYFQPRPTFGLKRSPPSWFAVNLNAEDSFFNIIKRFIIKWCILHSHLENVWNYS